MSFFVTMTILLRHNWLVCKSCYIRNGCQLWIWPNFHESNSILLYRFYFKDITNTLFKWNRMDFNLIYLFCLFLIVACQIRIIKPHQVKTEFIRPGSVWYRLSFFVDPNSFVQRNQQSYWIWTWPDLCQIDNDSFYWIQN